MLLMWLTFAAAVMMLMIMTMPLPLLLLLLPTNHYGSLIQLAQLYVKCTDNNDEDKNQMQAL